MTDMTSSVDRVLDAIDVGLQKAVPDPTFGEVSPPNLEECWRCCAAPPADGSTSGVCDDCRLELLAEEPCEWVDDEPDRASVLAPVVVSAERFSEDLRAFGATMAEWMESFALVFDTLPSEAQDLVLELGQPNRQDPTV